MQSKDISTMSSYLMMLYVTLEQESALKNFFLGQGWTFCKPDLSVTTDKLGPSTLKQIGQNQLEPYLETPVAPIYNKKRKPKSSKSKETPPLKQQKSAQKQQSNDELEEVGNVVEGEAVGSEAKETRLGQSSGAENRPGSSRSVVLEDGREVTVKIEADFSESDNNEDGESELKDNDDDVNDNLDDDNDETDVDYNFLEEGEIRLKNEDMSLPAGSQSGESSLLDHLHGDSIEDQSMLEDSLNNETKVEDGAKIKGMASTISNSEDDPEEQQYYSCDVCKKQFKSARGLNYHLPVHDTHRYKCDICDKSFHNEEGLKGHKKTHVPNKYVCSNCGKSFSTMYWLRRHEEVQHSHQMPCRFECKTCGKRCSSSAVLAAHMITHTAEKAYICDCCGKTYHYKCSLKRHIQTECTLISTKARQSVECEECGECKKSFKSSKLLKQHQRIHQAPMLYCHNCGKTFRWKNCLKMHLNSCKK